MQSFNIDESTVIGDTCGLFKCPGYGRHIVRTELRWEIIYVIQGSISFFVDDDRFEINGGQALVIKPGQLHGSINDYSSDLRFYWLHFFAEQTKDDGIRVPQLCTPLRPARFVEMLENYLFDIYSGRKNKKIKNLAVKMMLYELADVLNEQQPHHNPLASRIHTYIHEHITEPLHSAAIAEALGYSADYIERVYKKAFGETITEAVHKVRVFFGAELLKLTTMNVSEIAVVSGFKSAEDFYRVFKRVKGESPRRYRDSHSHGKMNII